MESDSSVRCKGRALHRDDGLGAVERERDAFAALLARIDAESRILIDGAGQTVWISGGAERLCARRGKLSSPPPAIIDAASRLVALGRRADPGACLVHAVPWILEDGTTLRADLSLLRTASGPLAEVVLTFAGLGRPLLDALAQHYGLSCAEAEVLNVLAEGLANQEIAKRLFVSRDTIRTHLRRINAKIGVTRAEAVDLVRSFGRADTPPAGRLTHASSGRSRWR
jgi:DNA-binding CsgD family transcriptional regulator